MLTWRAGGSSVGLTSWPVGKNRSWWEHPGETTILGCVLVVSQLHTTVIGGVETTIGGVGVGSCEKKAHQVLSALSTLCMEYLSTQ